MLDQNHLTSYNRDKHIRMIRLLILKNEEFSILLVSWFLTLKIYSNITQTQLNFLPLKNGKTIFKILIPNVRNEIVSKSQIVLKLGLSENDLRHQNICLHYED